MDKQDVYPDSGILFSLKKEGNSAATWLNLEDMLSEISRIQMDKYGMILLIRGTQNSQIHKDRKQNGGFQGLGERGVGNSYLIGIEFHLEDEKVMEVDGGDGNITA